VVVKRKSSKTAGSPVKHAPVKTGTKTPRPAAKGAVKTPEKPVVKPAPSPVKTPITRPAAVTPSLPKPEHKAAEASAALTEADLRKVKTGLTRKDLDHYQELLLQKRAEVLGTVDSLNSERENGTGGNLSNMPLHMADVGTENYEQENTLHLVESERQLLVEINDALLRIKNGTYGVCLERGVPINRARLDAKPWAKYCIEAAREKEKMGLPS